MNDGFSLVHMLESVIVPHGQVNPVSSMWSSPCLLGAEGECGRLIRWIRNEGSGDRGGGEAAQRRMNTIPFADNTLYVFGHNCRAQAAERQTFGH